MCLSLCLHASLPPFSLPPFHLRIPPSLLGNAFIGPDVNLLAQAHPARVRKSARGVSRSRLVAVAAHLALRSAALALAAVDLVDLEVDVVEGPLLRLLRQHLQRHLLVEAALEPTVGHVDVKELVPIVAWVVAALAVGATRVLFRLWLIEYTW